MFEFLKSKEKRLTEARTRLEENLETKGVHYIIDIMASNRIYSPLLKKKRKTEISNTDDESWYGYRRAEKLVSDNDKETLLRLLEEPEYNSKKKHLYFAIAHLCKNTTNVRLFNHLMDKIEVEKGLGNKLSILIGIQKMDKRFEELNIEPLKKLVKVRTRDLRINSILALQKTNDSEVEPLLLEMFQNTKDSHTKNMITTPLESVGTPIAIPILERAYKKTRDYGLRDSIERTIQEINKRNNTANTR